MVAGAWGPTAPSASAHQASLGSSANLVSAQGWDKGSRPALPCPENPGNHGEPWVWGAPQLGHPGGHAVPGPPPRVQRSQPHPAT